MKAFKFIDRGICENSKSFFSLPHLTPLHLTPILIHMFQGPARQESFLFKQWEAS